MRWTDNYPSEPGWYWRARRRGDIDIVRIGTDGTGYDVNDGFTTVHKARHHGERFAGPIEQPSPFTTVPRTLSAPLILANC